MIGLLSKQRGPQTWGTVPLSPPLSSDPAAVFHHLDGWYMAKGPVYSCAWQPTKLFTNIFYAGSVRLSWQPFLLQIHSLHSIPSDSEQHNRALKSRLTKPFQHKGTSWGLFTQLHSWMRWKEANLAGGHAEVARLLCYVPSSQITDSPLLFNFLGELTAHSVMYGPRTVQAFVKS